MSRITLCFIALCAVALPAFAGHSHDSQGVFLTFENMYAVDGPFITPEGFADPNIRGVPGDYQAWKINKFIKGRLFNNGRLVIQVRGLVFPNAPNDEDNFRALVSCLTEDGDQIATVNVTTAGFPTGPAGNAVINAKLQLPNPCVAPIVMILNGDPAEGDVWFAVTGVEQEQNTGTPRDGGMHN